MRPLKQPVEGWKVVEKDVEMDVGVKLGVHVFLFFLEEFVKILRCFPPNLFLFVVVVVVYLGCRCVYIYI